MQDKKIENGCYSVKNIENHLDTSNYLLRVKFATQFQVKKIFLEKYPNQVFTDFNQTYNTGNHTT